MDSVLHAISAPVWVVEPAHGHGGARVPGLVPPVRVVTANPAALSLHGATSLGQLLGRLDDIFPAEGRAALDRGWRGLRSGAARSDVDTTLATLAGRRLSVRVSLIRTDGGRAVLTIHERGPSSDSVAGDVYRQLAESEARFRIMADCAPVMLWMADPSTRCVFFNRGWLDFTGRTLEEELGCGWAGGVHPMDFQACMQGFLDAFVARRPFSMEYRLRRRDGEFRWILDQAVPRFAPDGGFAGYIGSCIDITQLKVLQHDLDARVQELGGRLREREVLLQEVHHRVKNNLQLVSSLLRMQSREADNPQVAAAIEECQGRVHSIAAIHDDLYLSRDFAQVALGRYVRGLATRVVQAAGASAQAVTVEVEAADVTVGVDRAIPCGLLVNELMTNALKHAFPDGRHGQVRVELTAPQPGRLSLAVTDDGIGIPSSVVIPHARTLGLRLVSILAEQLEGALEVERGGGSRFRVNFAGGA